MGIIGQTKTLSFFIAYERLRVEELHTGQDSA